MIKQLTEMSFAELTEALSVAAYDLQAADYQDGLAAYARARESAEARLAAVRAEIDARLSRLAVEEKEEKTDGG